VLTAEQTLDMFSVARARAAMVRADEAEQKDDGDGENCPLKNRRHLRPCDDSTADGAQHESRARARVRSRVARDAEHSARRTRRAQDRSQHDIEGGEAQKRERRRAERKTNLYGAASFARVAHASHIVLRARTQLAREAFGQHDTLFKSFVEGGV
jgi:hypothetical protein